jgi:hypothetical protein
LTKHLIEISTKNPQRNVDGCTTLDNLAHEAQFSISPTSQHESKEMSEQVIQDNILDLHKSEYMQCMNITDQE